MSLPIYEFVVDDIIGQIYKNRFGLKKEHN